MAKKKALKEKTPEEKAARNAYLKDWRKKNPDKVKANNDKHARTKTELKVYRAKSPEKYKATNKRARDARKLRDPSYETRSQRKLLYGWTHEQFLEAWEIQQGLCAICYCVMHHEGTTPTSVAADHLHGTPKLRRKLLCFGCNRGLGLFRENPAALVNAAKYIEAYGQSEEYR